MRLMFCRFFQSRSDLARRYRDAQIIVYRIFRGYCAEYPNATILRNGARCPTKFYLPVKPNLGALVMDMVSIKQRHQHIHI